MIKGKELTIRFIADKAYITEAKPLPFTQTNLPPIAKTFSAPANWTVRVLSHVPEEKRLFVEVLSYNIGSGDLDSHQLDHARILEEIDKVTFRTIDTDGLINTLKGSRSVSVISRPTFRSYVNYKGDDITPIQYKSYNQTIKENFFVPIKNLRFKQGGVLFERKLKGTKKKHEFEIRNDDLIEEFDAIKNYFANVLKTKKIEVFVTAEVLFDTVTPISVTSPEIDKIDRNIIENVKLETVKATTKWSPTVNSDSTLFTMDEYFKAFGEENFKPSVFYNEGTELLKDLVKITETKHYKHLAYLSRNHDSDSMKLRFSHKPLSFVFLIKGDEHNHFIWETLDTEEATYVWRFPLSKGLRSAFDEVEGYIKTIKLKGKTAYLDLNSDYFSRVNHKYKEDVDGFIEWKRKLKDLLT